MPKASSSSRRRLSSASLGSTPREVERDILPLDMSIRRASDAGIKFRTPLTPDIYHGQKRRYNRRTSRAQEGLMLRAASETPAISTPSPTFLTEIGFQARVSSAIYKISFVFSPISLLFQKSDGGTHSCKPQLFHDAIARTIFNGL